MRALRPTKLLPALMVLAGLMVLAAAVAFARADQARRLAADAAELGALESALAEAATYRADLAIAVVAASARGASPEPAVQAAMRALERMEAELAPIADPEIEGLVDELVSGSEQLFSALQDGDLDTVDDVASELALPALDALGSRLEERSAEAEARIEAEQASAGRVARLSSFVVALIAPTAAVWALRRSVRKRLERQRLEADLLRHRELAAAKDELIAGLSHQLRTPLTGIYGFAETMLDAARAGSLDPGLVEEGTVTILDESHRLRRMVDDILVAARADAEALSFHLEWVEPDREVEAAVEPFRKAGHSVEVELEPGVVHVDRLRLRHILCNLLDNAVSYGGAAVVRGTAQRDRYLLAVEDEGPGIAEGAHERLFERFVHSGSEATVTGSLGLGLSVARTLAVRMGGHITHSRADGVTRFVVSLPKAESPAPIPVSP